MKLTRQSPKVDRDTLRISVSSLFLLLLLQVDRISSVECVNSNHHHHQYNSNRSNHHYGANDGPPKFYSNHRMLFRGDDRTTKDSQLAATLSNNHTTLIHIDQTADSSMPRPQLALQIFTTSPVASNHRATDQQQQEHQQFKNMTSNQQQQPPARLLNTMLLMPVPSLLTRPIHRSESKNFEPAAAAGSTSSASQRNYLIDLGSQSQNKPSQWHYVTEAHSPPTDHSSPRGKSSTNADDGGGSGGVGSSPLINAIITVPAQTSEHHHHHHHQEQDGATFSQRSSVDNNTAAQLVDKTIAQLLDGQSTGNIEFSMDLNGEEIVINPVRSSSHHGRSMEGSTNSTRDLLLNRSKLDMSPSEADSDDTVQASHNVGRRSKHLIESDTPHIPRKKQNSQAGESVENQQSASEIDLVDESNDQGESGSDSDGSIESSGGKKTNLDQLDREADKLDDERSFPATSGATLDDGENQLDLDETLSEEPTQTQVDSESGRISLRKTKAKSRPVGSRKQSRDSLQTVRKLALGSRRRVALKSDDSIEQQSAINRREVKQASASSSSKEPSLSTVMIKGEDLQRLEQLIQTLRSASLVDLTNQHQKQQKRLTSNSQGKPRRDYPTDDGGNFKREETEPRTTHQAENESWDGQDQKGSRHQVKSSQVAAKMTGKNELITLSDCDRRKQQKQLRRVAPSDEDNGSYESDSSQEPFSEPNDDGTEKEEQGSDNYNSLSLPIRDHEDRDQPRAIFVRKTILQSYYDDNLRQPIIARHTERDSPSYGSSNDELAINRDQGREHAISQVRQQLARSYSAGGKLRGQGSSRSENYIDYSKLDDRDVYRGLPSAATNRTYQDHH